MKLSNEALNLLRDYRDVVEPEALMFRQSVIQGATVGALCPVYGTQRPDEPLLHTLAHGGKLYWKPQLIESYIRWECSTKSDASSVSSVSKDSEV